MDIYQVIDEIKELEMNILDKKLEIADLDKKSDEIELEISDSVLNATDSNGKSLYSNESKRKIAISEQLNEHSEYNTMLNNRKTMDYDLKRDEIELRYKQNLFKILLVEKGK